MDIQELQDIVLRNTTEIAEIRRQLTDLTSKEKRVEVALRELRRKLESCLSTFDRDRYKSTDQRLLIEAIADEILIFDKLGYDLGVSGAPFLLGVAAVLEGRNQVALEHFHRFIKVAENNENNRRDAHYLAGMITYLDNVTLNECSMTPH